MRRSTRSIPRASRTCPTASMAASYQWVDLDSEGLTGVLTEQADAWYYKRNLGNGTFGPIERVAPKPSFAALSGGRQQLLDLAGEGHLDLVQYDGPMAGFHERTPDGGWEGFTPFQVRPEHQHQRPESPLRRRHRRRFPGHPDLGGYGLHLV